MFHLVCILHFIHIGESGKKFAGENRSAIGNNLAGRVLFEVIMMGFFR
jgi:hypothetical protein